MPPVYLEFLLSFLYTIEYSHTVLPNFYIGTSILSPKFRSPLLLGITWALRFSHIAGVICGCSIDHAAGETEVTAHHPAFTNRLEILNLITAFIEYTPR
jgi:hypothetical protein